MSALDLRSEFTSDTVVCRDSSLSLRPSLQFGKFQVTDACIRFHNFKKVCQWAVVACQNTEVSLYSSSSQSLTLPQLFLNFSRVWMRLKYNCYNHFIEKIKRQRLIPSIVPL